MQASLLQGQHGSSCKSIGANTRPLETVHTFWDKTAIVSQLSLKPSFLMLPPYNQQLVTHLSMSIPCVVLWAQKCNCCPLSRLCHVLASPSLAISKGSKAPFEAEAAEVWFGASSICGTDSKMSFLNITEKFLISDFYYKTISIIHCWK